MNWPSIMDLTSFIFSITAGCNRSAAWSRIGTGVVVSKYLGPIARD